MPWYAVKFRGTTPDPQQRKSLEAAGIVYDGSSAAEGAGSFPVHRLVDATDSVDALGRSKDCLGPQEGRQWLDSVVASEDPGV
jgi:hypothetical protein